MPFKLKLKKSRQYNVSSKSLFVISVHHLLVFDTPTTVDCTLSSESTGLECLSNVCQRLSINQLEFFGLRYVVKGSTKNDGEELRWVDLERPLSRQLDKYAASPRLYLRVMYYVISGVTLINDEVTRNYYFLQLKSDIVEGRISCDPKQAVILAMYCRQAQYDSHQNERHTVEYLKNLLPFPPSAIEAGHSLETLTEAVLQPNAEIQNLTQAMAEGLFITACQQLDGYGQEKFDAKDDCSAEVTLGITVSGIAVSANENSKFYPWHEISNVVNHKRTFNIECTEPDKSVGFNLCDTETGRYFWKLCVLQHTFYIKYEKNQNHSSPEGNFNLFQNLPDDLTESKDNLFVEQPNLYASDSHISAGNWQTDSVVSSNMSLAQSQQQLKPQFNQNWVTPMMPDNFTTRNSNWGLVGSNASLNNRAQSSSCLDLSNNNISSHDKERLKAFLPGYRSAPDYETAVQQKYRASESELRVNNLVHVQPTGVVTDTHMNNYSGSQPDVHRVTAVADAIFGQQLQYPDVTQTTNSVYQQHFDPNVIRLDGLSQQLQMMRFNKPPPPYPANRLSSTSTPDLALASHRALCYQAYVSGSSPDLVSTRTFLNSQYQGPQQPSIPSNTFRYRYSQSHIPHGTYENLNLNFPENQTKTNLLSQKIQKAYDAAYRVPNQQQAGLIGSHQLNGSIDPIEPIYENINVPLPNPTDGITNNEMRDRASSVQSAPGVMRFKQQQQQPPHQHQPNPNQQQHQPPQPILNDTHNFNVTKPAIFFDRQPDHVPVTKAQSNPIVVQHQVLQNSQSQDLTENHPSIAMHQQQTSRKSSTPIEQNSRLNRSYPQFDSLNRSQSTNVLDSSQSSSYTNTTTTTDSGINCSEHRNSKEKKKRRWNFWGGGSKGSLSDKQKSATLGRDKEKSMNALTKNEESNLRHRWSTGLPRLPLLATISKEKLCQILETKLSDPQLYVEFERIPKRKENARYDCALHEENRMKNFDPNFLPYDDNRVRLTPTRDNRLGYYNASHITATVGAKQRFYIVAQSPNAVPALNTFLQCVWEADVYLLVQLSDEVNYVPPTSDKCLEYGQYQIWQEFSQVTDRCVTSKLRIYHTQSRRYRSVWHLRYCEWIEQNCPKDVGQFLEFLEELSSVRLASINEVPPGHNTNPPVLIHCSEGGGRAGVTLAADLLLYTLDHNQDLDIPRVLSQLRQQRDNIVPSLAQYKFVYALIINYLKRTRLI